MKFNSDVIRLLHKTLGDSFVMILIFDKGKPRPLISNLISVKRLSNGRIVNLYEGLNLDEGDSVEKVTKQLKSKMKGGSYCG